ncbi:CPBP family intramembrane metalloprotease [Comamonadaceae bacterium G21597-S1]|nr:CPBP family intramembrane metalloprotease [Comamonadaceae bacterium G21597-S1]
MGVLALALQPPPASLVEQVPRLQSLHPLALRALVILNPLILVSVCAAVGASVAHRAGLGSHVATTARNVLSPRLAVAGGALVAVVLFALDAAMAPHLGSPWQEVKAHADNAPWFPGLAIGVLYGGIAEEVIMRWGVMSLVAWLLCRLFALRSKAVGATPGMPARLAQVAIVVSAGVFAAGHLPALAQSVDLSAPLVARTLGLNMLAGLVYGWLFWRRSLETAMIAHGTTHVGFVILRSLT